MEVVTTNVDTVDPGGIPLNEEEHLREENKLLQGKVRGYATLGKLLQESKDEVKTLKDFQKKYEDLVLRVSESDLRSVLKDAQLIAVKKMEESSGSKASVFSEGTTIASEDLFGSGTNRKAMQDEPLAEAESSNLATSAIPEDKELSLSESMKFPMQESLQASVGSDGNAAPMESPVSEDADRYEKEENNYPENSFVFAPLRGVKINNQLTTTEQLEKNEFVHVSYGPSSPRSSNPVFPELDSRTDIFSSLGQETGHGYTARAASESPSDNPNMTPNFPMFSPNPSNEDELSIKISKLASEMHASPWALEFQKISENAIKMERKEKAAKAIAGTLMENMKHMKTHHSFILHEKDREVLQLRKENHQLLHKVKKLERERDAMASPDSPPGSVSSQTAVVDWVHVDPQAMTGRLKAENIQKNSSTDDLALQQQVNIMRMERNKFAEVNVNWERHWNEKKISYETKITNLKTEVKALNNKMVENIAAEERRNQDYDRLLLDAKRKAEDELMTKEETLRKLDAMTARCGAMSAKIQDQEQTLMIAQQEKVILLTENQTIKASKSPSAQSQSQSAPIFSAATNKTITALQTENCVLRQQLTVFQEDFDKERTDRAKAQSQKDNLQTKLNDAIQQMKVMEMQVKSAEHNLKSTLDENSRLMHENQTLKNRVRHLSEAETQQQWTPQPPPNHAAAQREQIKYAQQTAQPISALHRQPQLLPGAWACARCTVVNYPGRTVCEVCGQVQSPQVTRPQNPPGYMTGYDCPAAYGQQNLTSRGQSAGNDVPDLTEDNPNKL